MASKAETTRRGRQRKGGELAQGDDEQRDGDVRAILPLLARLTARATTPAEARALELAGELVAAGHNVRHGRDETRRRATTEAIARLSVEASRAHDDETPERHVRNRLVELVDRAAERARSVVSAGEAELGEAAEALAQDVARLVADVDPSRAPRLEAARPLLATAIRVTATNRGGRGKRAAEGETRAATIERLTKALGLGASYDAIRRGKTAR